MLLKISILSLSNAHVEMEFSKAIAILVLSKAVGLMGISPEIHTDRDGVSLNFFLNLCLSIPTPVNAFFKTSNEPILKYCLCHTVPFFLFFFNSFKKLVFQFI